MIKIILESNKKRFSNKSLLKESINIARVNKILDYFLDGDWTNPDIAKRATDVVFSQEGIYAKNMFNRIFNGEAANDADAALFKKIFPGVSVTRQTLTKEFIQDTISSNFFGTPYIGLKTSSPGTVPVPDPTTPTLTINLPIDSEKQVVDSFLDSILKSNNLNISANAGAMLNSIKQFERFYQPPAPRPTPPKITGGPYPSGVGSWIPNLISVVTSVRAWMAFYAHAPISPVAKEIFYNLYERVGKEGTIKDQESLFDNVLIEVLQRSVYEGKRAQVTADKLIDLIRTKREVSSSPGSGLQGPTVKQLTADEKYSLVSQRLLPSELNTMILVQDSIGVLAESQGFYIKNTVDVFNRTLRAFANTPPEALTADLKFRSIKLCTDFLLTVLNWFVPYKKQAGNVYNPLWRLVTTGSGKGTELAPVWFVWVASTAGQILLGNLLWQKIKELLAEYTQTLVTVEEDLVKNEKDPEKLQAKKTYIKTSIEIIEGWVGFAGGAYVGKAAIPRKGAALLFDFAVYLKGGESREAGLERAEKKGFNRQLTNRFFSEVQTKKLKINTEIGLKSIAATDKDKWNNFKNQFANIEKQIDDTQKRIDNNGYVPSAKEIDALNKTLDEFSKKLNGTDSSPSGDSSSPASPVQSKDSLNKILNSNR